MPTLAPRLAPRASSRSVANSQVRIHGASLSRNRSWRDNPPHRLAGNPGDQVVVPVVMQDRDPLSFGDGRDEQVRQANSPHLPSRPQRSLDIECPPPIFVVGRQPLIASVPVGPNLLQ